LDVGRPECSGGFSSEHFWIDGLRLRAATKVPQRGKGRAVPELLVDLLNLLSIDGGVTRWWFMNEISRSNVFSLLSANQRLLERLEAENAQLWGSVVELVLQIKALRDALGRPQSET
jgi:hypothetical protein